MRRLRLDRDMTQEDLAEGSGLHSTEISRIERGVREVRLGTIVKVVAALKTAPADLLDGVR